MMNINQVISIKIVWLLQLLNFQHYVKDLVPKIIKIFMTITKKVSNKIPVNIFLLI